MNILLILFIVGICALGLRSPEIMQAIGMAGSAQDPAKVTVERLTGTSATQEQNPMSADEFAALSKTDPNAYHKYVNSHRVQERTEADKLMNFFARGKYE